MKYSFTEESKVVGGVTLKRIIAERDIPRYGISKGDLGGWHFQGRPWGMAGV